jgi:hypothetical protein
MIYKGFFRNRFMFQITGSKIIPVKIHNKTLFHTPNEFYCISLSRFFLQYSLNRKFTIFDSDRYWFVIIMGYHT